MWGKLPLNAGFDDIFVVSLFIGSLLKSNLKLTPKWPFLAAILFCVFALFGDLTTYIMGYDLRVSEITKRFLKSLGVVCLVYSTCATAKSHTNVERLYISFLIGCAIGGLLVILYSLKPTLYNPFQVPAWKFTHKGMSEYQVVGPFLSHDRAGGLLGFASILTFFHARLIKLKLKKALYIFAANFFFLSLLVSGSRSGYLFVCFPVAISIMISKKRFLGSLIIVAFLLTGLVAYNYVGYFSKRLDVTVEQWETGDLQGRTAGRFEVWKDALSQPTIRWLFFGEGFSIEQTHPHSNYIAILKNMGLVGIFFWIFYYYSALSKARHLIKFDKNNYTKSLAVGISWAYIGYFIFFITSTPVMWSPVRYVDFFLMTLVHIRSAQIGTVVPKSWTMC